MLPQHKTGLLERNKTRANDGAKMIMVLMGVCLVVYIMARPLYWHFAEVLSSSFSCPPCFCDCNSEPLFSVPLDCMRHDLDVIDNEQKSFMELLSDELKLKEAEAEENLRRADMALLEAKKTTSQYQKEADKCNSGMEYCEEAREKAEAIVEAQKRLTAMWELRARQRGWKESDT
ncbi:Protein of unknown function DUF1068 [Dillenia turbinata]|uniref:Uncharacterized protein n=1 Tax=Dillenia turbinata TaxID=194707 RepID=A0AAN8VMS3_9MAGN